MILNLLVIAFIGAMGVMWSTYGLFSAFIHLLVVIASGALAFSFWELFVYKLFMGVAPQYAWGAGLVVPFAVFVIGFRVPLDLYIRGNLRFARLPEQILGFGCGVLSGILTAGVTIIGIGFLPLPPSIAGWRPYEVQSDGGVVAVEGGGLWFSVDTMAAGFFNRLSAGSFAPGGRTRLSTWVPDIDKQAAVSRLAGFYDPNQNRVATPGTVEANSVNVFSGESLPHVVDPLIDQHLGGKRKIVGGGSLVAVATTWSKDGGVTYDRDSILRVPPTQIRLHVVSDQNTGQLLPPIAFSKPNAQGQAEFFPVVDNQIVASSPRPTQQITWYFAPPPGAEPYFLLARNTRVPLPESINANEGEPFDALIAGIGRPFDPEDTAAAQIVPTKSAQINTEPVGYATHRVYSADEDDGITARISKNNAVSFTYTDEDAKADSALTGGSGTLKKGTSGRGNNVDRIFVSSDLRPLRLQLGAHTPPPGGTPVGNRQEVYVTDALGNRYYSYAYVLKQDDGDLKANVSPVSEFRFNTDLPFNEIRPGETLYTYFRIPPGSLIKAYHIGPAMQQLDFQVGP